MTDKYNKQLSQLAGLITAFASEIENDTNLLKGEKFLILQRIFADLKPLEKAFENAKKEIENWTKDNLHDQGEGKSKEVEMEGASVFVKYSYPKPTIDTNRVIEDFSRLLADYNQEFDKTKYEKQSTPRKQIIIQSIIQK
jgi:cell division protein YceG involved in septum cleavage